MKYHQILAQSNQFIGPLKIKSLRIGSTFDKVRRELCKMSKGINI